ncbi:SPOR domain-containing protein [Azoarcus olearius]|uniref:Conserved hypothetical secreted protein n=1 Tax=Azoarcus sp. (strain BH72) TaxID=418699 RepID=A1K2E3_AZOSB|nr:SPOR domain-containing protein [Azoarcus olearius]CAL92998.1 conserved hypothetical secreted protein [Azoarcus olearius]
MSRDRKPTRKPARSPARSGGGTLVGIFIGLVMGAVIAAGAAWYFTRANPFQAAAPAPARAPVAVDQPPAALPGKPGDRPVVKQDFEFYKILPQGDGATHAAVEPPKPVEKAPEKPAEKLWLQVGAFGAADEAENLKARLALSGIQASSQRAQLADGRVVQRVRIGPFDKPEDMNSIRARLASAGFEASVTKSAP